MKLAHISDLHIGSSLHVPEWGERVREVINSEDPDVLVISGDVTDSGMVPEYKKALEYLDGINISKKNSVLVPGNHDSRHAGYEVFEKFFGKRYAYYEDEEFSILGLDSSQPDLNSGEVGREHYSKIKEKLSNPDKTNILVLHHHLLPVPNVGRERDTVTDAGDVLKLCTQSGVNMVLNGHRHRRWFWNLQGTYFVTGGTATSKKLNGFSYPSFNIIESKDGEVTLKEYNVKEEKFKEIFQDSLRNEPGII